MRAHFRHVGWISGDEYCGACGFGSGWPCKHANRRDRAASAAGRWADRWLYWPMAIWLRVRYCMYTGHEYGFDDSTHCLTCGAPWRKRT